MILDSLQQVVRDKTSKQRSEYGRENTNSVSYSYGRRPIHTIKKEFRMRYETTICGCFYLINFNNPQVVQKIL